MNARNSWLVFIAVVLCFAIGFVGFARGSASVEPGAKVAWICGSLVLMSLVVFLSYKLRKK